MPQPAANRWVLLIHQIPPKPDYFRVKVGRRLQRLGAVAIKNSVYVLPRSDETVEDFQWQSREIVAGGGEASVCEANFVDGLTDTQIEALFRTARNADYGEIVADAQRLRKATDGRGQVAADLSRLKRRLVDVVAIDFFGAPRRRAAQEEVARLEARLRPRDMQDSPPAHRPEGAVQVRRRRGIPAAAGRAPIRHVRGRVHARGGRLHLRDARYALRARRSCAPRHRGDRARHRLQGGEVRAARGLWDRATDRRHRAAARGGHRAGCARHGALRRAVRGAGGHHGRDRRGPQDEEVVATVSLRAFLLYFLRLGTLGFGGPIVLAGHMQQDLVEQRGWINAQEYKEGLAFAQLAPGPLAAQLAIYLGWVRGRVPGATLVGIAFVAPSFLMVLVLSDLYVRFGGLPWMQGLFYGIGAAVIAIIARSALKLVRMTLGRDRLLWILFAVSAVVTAWTESEIIWVFLVCGLVPMVLRRRQTTPATAALGLLPVAPGLTSGLGGPASVGVLWKILTYFAGASLFVLGSEVGENLPEHTHRRGASETASETRSDRQKPESGGRRSRLPSSEHHRHEPAHQEDPDDLGLGPRRHYGAHGEQNPEQSISAQRHPHEFQRTASDDGNDRGADPIEQPLHPR